MSVARAAVAGGMPTRGDIEYCWFSIEFTGYLMWGWSYGITMSHLHFMG